MTRYSTRSQPWNCGCANPASSEPNVNTANPAMYSCLRPKMSASRPTTGTSAVVISRYASSTHMMVRKLAPRPVRTSGSAMISDEPWMAASSAPTLVTESATHSYPGWGRSSSGLVATLGWVGSSSRRVAADVKKENLSPCELRGAGARQLTAQRFEPLESRALFGQQGLHAGQLAGQQLHAPNQNRLDLVQDLAPARRIGRRVILAAQDAPLVLGLEKRLDFRQAQPDDFAQLLDQLEPLEILVVETAIPASNVGGRLQQAQLLVVTDGTLAETGRLSRLANAPQARSSAKLDH